MPDLSRPDPRTVPPGAGPAGSARRLAGLGVSQGRAAGPMIRMAGPPALPAPRPVTDPAAEAATVAKGLEAVTADLNRRAAAARSHPSEDQDGATGGRAGASEAAEILEALAMMAEDPMLLEEAERRALDGADAAHALDAAFARHRDALAELGGYLAERAADLDDLKHRAVAFALGLPMPGLPAPGHPYVLVAEDLSPADTAGLGPDVLALVTERGGPTSHTAILARGRGLPAVVACAGVMDLPDGTVIGVDGGTGEITTGLTAERAAEIVAGERAERARLAAGSGPGRTADGHPVKLLLNIGSAKDLRPGAEGVGLFRTEFLFLDRTGAPSFEEQVAAYAEVFEQAETVIVRTLDAGTDKPLPFLGLPAEPNPALGVRGLRVDRVLPDVLDTQLDAIAEAARATGTQAWVMAPMVTTVAEAAGFAGRARERGIAKVGAMVEVPAAALRAGALLREVDFLSIGTNDLAQYTFAADRQHSELADLLDPRQPALLQLIGMCARAGREAGKPVGVCGEAAGDPLLAPLLAGLGVTSLSMAPVCVPAVREALAGLTSEECQRRAEEAVG
ncbi:phosphoenolpyruvate--protein phosphotransferase [Nonomuraea sp. KC401]|uniref:phosphoenolpyruvate--protein phosphotransferase n=1 Tax=unclassified Nonomuraea TaxID=2593643 RepID=UPI0010FD4724|nr:MULTISPECIES: phosphoenolpyruvate--protein phosphotransferase [unclassified Nonomuraea]NBE99928.1 phosphoenolpyruvate--protein phosphotransferase [Nonomuraea sp. K271]TLF55099.1 phosphoenolpyruvate--protein phosphotransferase [Nonomuraea sp. KC401]